MSSFSLPAAIFIASIVYLIGGFKLNFGSTSIPAEGFVPLIIGILLFGGSCILMIEALLKFKKMEVSSANADKKEIVSISLFMGILIGYALLLPILGFTFCTFTLIIASAKIMRSSLKSAFILAAGAVIVSHFLFIRWLQIPFPSSVF